MHLVVSKSQSHIYLAEVLQFLGFGNIYLWKLKLQAAILIVELIRLFWWRTGLSHNHFQHNQFLILRHQVGHVNPIHELFLYSSYYVVWRSSKLRWKWRNIIENMPISELFWLTSIFRGISCNFFFTTKHSMDTTSERIEHYLSSCALER